MITIVIPIDVIAIIIATMFYFIGVFTIMFKVIDSLPPIDSIYYGFVFVALLITVWLEMMLYIHLFTILLN